MLGHGARAIVAPVPEHPREAAAWQQALRSAAPCRGPLRSALALASLASAALAAWIAFSEAPGSLRYPDAYDYAQMGRQLAEGSGMTSLQSFPYVLGWLDARAQDTAPPWPIVWRFPLPVVARALSFQLLGPTQTAALLPALLFSVLTAPALFLLANRLGGPLAGALAAGLWIASPSQQQFALTGLTEPGAALLAVAIAGATVFARDDRGWQRSLVLGAALGIGFLDRTNLLALAPAACVIVACTPGLTTRVRLARLAAVAGAALLVASPWLLRNALAFGDPLLNLTSDRGFLRLGLGRDPFYEYGVADRGALLRESLALYPAGWSWAWLRDNGLDLLGRDFRWLVPLAALAALIDARRPRGQIGWLAWSGLLLTAIVFAPPYPHILRFYWPYAPLLLGLTSTTVLAGLLRFPDPRVAPLGAAAILAGFLALAPRGDVAPLLPLGPEPAPVAWLAERVEPNRIIASDASYAVAWQARRPSVRFSANLGVMGQIDEAGTRIEALHSVRNRAPFATVLNQPPLATLFAPVPAERGTLFVRRPRAAVP